MMTGRPTSSQRQLCLVMLLVVATVLAFSGFASAKLLDACSFSVASSYRMETPAPPTYKWNTTAAPTTYAYFNLNNITRTSDVTALRATFSVGDDAYDAIDSAPCEFLKFTRDTDSWAPIVTMRTDVGSTVAFDLFEANLDIGDNSLYIRCVVAPETDDEYSRLLPVTVEATVATVDEDDVVSYKTVSEQTQCAGDTEVIHLKNSGFPQVGITSNHADTPLYTVTLRGPGVPVLADEYFIGHLDRITDPTTPEVVKHVPATLLTAAELAARFIMVDETELISLADYFAQSYRYNEETAAEITPAYLVRCTTGFRCIGFSPLNGTKPQIEASTVIATQMIAVSRPQIVEDLIADRIIDADNEYHVDVSVTVGTLLVGTVPPQAIKGFQCRIQHQSYSSIDIMSFTKTAASSDAKPAFTASVQNMEIYSYDQEKPVELVCVVYFDGNVVIPTWASGNKLFDLTWTWQKSLKPAQTGVPGAAIKLGLHRTDALVPVQKLVFTSTPQRLDPAATRRITRMGTGTDVVVSSTAPGASCATTFTGLPTTGVLAAPFTISDTMAHYRIAASNCNGVASAAVPVLSSTHGLSSSAMLTYYSGFLKSGYYFARLTVDLVNAFAEFDTGAGNIFLEFALPTGVTASASGCAWSTAYTPAPTVAVVGNVIKVQYTSPPADFDGRAAFTCGSVKVDSTLFIFSDVQTVAVTHYPAAVGINHPRLVSSMPMRIREVHTEVDEATDLTTWQSAAQALLPGGASSARFYQEGLQRAFEVNFLHASASASYSVELPSSFNDTITFTGCRVSSGANAADVTTVTYVAGSTSAYPTVTFTVPNTVAVSRIPAVLRCMTAACTATGCLVGTVAQTLRISSGAYVQHGIFHAYDPAVSFGINAERLQTVNTLSAITFNYTGPSSANVRVYAREALVSQDVTPVVYPGAAIALYTGSTPAASFITKTVAVGTELSLTTLLGVDVDGLNIYGRQVSLQSSGKPFFVYVDVVLADETSRVASSRILYTPDAVILPGTTPLVAAAAASTCPAQPESIDGRIEGWVPIAIAGAPTSAVSYFSKNLRNTTVVPEAVVDGLETARAFFLQCTAGDFVATGTTVPGYIWAKREPERLADPSAVPPITAQAEDGSLRVAKSIQVTDVTKYYYQAGTESSILKATFSAASTVWVLFYDKYDSVDPTKSVLAALGSNTFTGDDSSLDASLPGAFVGVYTVGANAELDVRVTIPVAATLTVRVFHVETGLYLNFGPVGAQRDFFVTGALGDDGGAYTFEAVASASQPNAAFTSTKAVSSVYRGVPTQVRLHFKAPTRFAGVFTVTFPAANAAGCTGPLTFAYEKYATYSSATAMTCSGLGAALTLTADMITVASTEEGDVSSAFSLQTSEIVVVNTCATPTLSADFVASPVYTEAGKVYVDVGCAAAGKIFVGDRRVECIESSWAADNRHCIDARCPIPTDQKPDTYTQVITAPQVDLGTSTDAGYFYTATFSCLPGLTFGTQSEMSYICAHNANGTAAWYSTIAADAEPLDKLPSVACRPTSNECFGLMSFSATPVGLEANGALHTVIYPAKDARMVKENVKIWHSGTPRAPAGDFTIYGAYENSTAYGAESTYYHFGYNIYPVGSTVRVECAPGFRPKPDTAFTVTSACSGGTWSDDINALECVPIEGCSTAPLKAYTSALLEDVLPGGALTQTTPITCADATLTFSDSLLACSATGFINKLDKQTSTVATVCSAAQHCLVPLNFALSNTALGADFDRELLEHDIQHGQDIQVTCDEASEPTGVRPVCYNGAILQAPASEALCRRKVGCTIPAHLAEVGGASVCPAGICPIGVTPSLNCIGDVNQAVGVPVKCLADDTWSASVPISQCVNVGCPATYLTTTLGLTISDTTSDHTSSTQYTDRTWAGSKMYAFNSVIAVGCPAANFGFVDLMATPAVVSQLKFKCNTDHTWSVVPELASYSQTCSYQPCDIRSVHTHYSAAAQAYVNKDRQLEAPLVTIGSVDLHAFLALNSHTAALNVYTESEIEVSCPGAAITVIPEKLTCLAGSFVELPNPCQSYCMSLDATNAIGTAVAAKETHTCAGSLVFTSNNANTLELECNEALQWVDSIGTVVTALPACVEEIDCNYTDVNGMKLEAAADGYLSCSDALFDLSADSPRFARCSTDGTTTYTNAAGTASAVQPTCERILCETPDSVFAREGEFQTDFYNVGVVNVTLGTRVRLSCATDKQLMQSSPLYNVMASVVTGDVFAECTKANGWQMLGSVAKEHLFCAGAFCTLPGAAVTAEDTYRYLSRPATADNTGAWTAVPLAESRIRVGYEYTVACAADDYAPKRVHKICRHEVDTTTGAINEDPTFFSLLPAPAVGEVEPEAPFCSRTTCDMSAITLVGGTVQKFIKSSDSHAAYIRLACTGGKSLIKNNKFFTEVTASCDDTLALAGYACADACEPSYLDDIYNDLSVSMPNLQFSGGRFATPVCHNGAKLQREVLAGAGGFQCTPTGWQVITTDGLAKPDSDNVPVCQQNSCKIPAAYGDFANFAGFDISSFPLVDSGFVDSVYCPSGYTGSIVVECRSGVWYSSEVEINPLTVFADTCAPIAAPSEAHLLVTGDKHDQYIRISVLSANVPTDAADKAATFENCMRFFAFATVAKFGTPADVSCWTNAAGNAIEIAAAADSTVEIGDKLYVLPGVVGVMGEVAVLSTNNVLPAAPSVEPIESFEVTQCQRAVVAVVATANNFTRAFTFSWLVDGEAVSATGATLDLGLLTKPIGDNTVVVATVRNWLGQTTTRTVDIYFAGASPVVADGTSAYKVMAGEGLTVPRFVALSTCGAANGGVLSYTWVESGKSTDDAVIPGIALNRHASTLVIPPKALKSSVELDLIITETYSVASGIAARRFLLSDIQDYIEVAVIDNSLVATVQDVEGLRVDRIWDHNVYDWDASLSIDGTHAHDTDVVGSLFDDRFHFRWECKFNAAEPSTDLGSFVGDAFKPNSDLDDCGLDYVSANANVNYENWEKENARFTVSNRDLVRLFDFDRHQTVNILVRLRVSKIGASSQNSAVVRVRLHNTVGAAGYFVPTFELTAPGVAAAPFSSVTVEFGPSANGIDVSDYAFLRTGVVESTPESGDSVTVTTSNVQYFPSDANIVLRPTISTPDSDFSSLFICTFDVHAAALTPLINTRELVIDAKYFRTIDTAEDVHRCTYVIFPQRDISAFESVRDIIDASIADNWFVASATMHFAVVAPVQTKVTVSATAQGDGMYLVTARGSITCTHYRFFAAPGSARTSIGSGRVSSIYTKLSPGAQSISVDCIVAHEDSKLWRTYTGSVLVVVPGAQQLRGTAAAQAALSAASDAIAANNAYFFAQAIPAALAASADVVNATQARAAYLQMIQSNPQLFARAETTATAVASAEGAQLKLQALAGVLAQPKQTTPDTIETTLKLQGEQIAALAQTSATTADSAKIALQTLVNAAAAAAAHASPATSAAVIDALSQQLGPIVVTAIRSQSAPSTIESPLVMSEGAITVTAFQASTDATGSAFASGVAGHTLSADLFEQFAAKGIKTIYSATVTLSSTHAVANAGANVPVNYVSQLVGVSLYGPNGVSLDTSDFGRARIMIPHVGGFSGADFYFPTCQFFNAGSSSGELSSESDAWGTSGCRTAARTEEYTVCQCTHLTLFRARINYDGSDAWASLTNENVKDNMTPLYVVFVWMAVFVVFVLIAKAIDAQKKAEAVKLLMLQWHKDVELGAAPAGTGKPSTAFTRAGALMSRNQLFFSVFARSVFDPIASAPRMAAAMVVGLVSFALTAMFWGGIKTRNSLDNYAGVIFLAAVLLVIVNVLVATLLRASHKSGPKEFLYTYALELAALYHTGTSSYFSKSEQGQLKAGANHAYRGVYQNILAEEKKGNTQTVRSLLRSAVALDKKHVIKTLAAKDTATTGAAAATYAFFAVLSAALAIIIVAFGIQLGLTVGTSVGKWIGTGFAAIALDIFILSPIVFFAGAACVADAAAQDGSGRGLTAYNSDSFDEYVIASNKTYTPYVPAVAVSTQAVETQPMTSAATARSTAHEEEAPSDAEAVAVEIVADVSTPAETNA